LRNPLKLFLNIFMEYNINNETHILEKMLVWILLLFLASGNGQFTQESTESTPRLPWNRYDDWDQNVGFRNQNENVIIKES